MSVVGSNVLAGASGAAGSGYEISRSLRFNSGDSAYLSRTSSASNRRTWTWSGWVKRSGIGTNDPIFEVAGSSTEATQFALKFHSNDYISIDYGGAFYLQTTRLFRDTSAWMHLVVVVDTTSSTADNRVRLYVNGIEETVFTTRNNPNQNVDLAVNRAAAHTISASSNGLDGYLAEIHLVDGQALSASSFGEYDDDNNWIPKSFTHGTAKHTGDWIGDTAGTPYGGAVNGSDKAFDGDDSTGSAANTGTAFVFTPSTPITGISKVRIRAVRDSSQSDDDGLQLNGTAIGSNWTAGAAVSEVEITVNNLTSLRWETNSISHWYKVYKIEIYYEGAYHTLVQGDINSFHLDFSDNSSNAALGTDSSGNSNTWTVNNLTAVIPAVDVGGDPTVSSSDKPFTTGYSVAFDGNDKLRVEGPGTVSGDFTWECWIKFTGTPAGRFFSAEESVNSTQYSLMRFYNGSFNVYVGDGNAYEANTYTGSISADAWHHIAMVRSGSTVSHYLDGSRWGTNTFSNSFPITTLVLGQGYGGEYFTGSISNARFVNGQALYTGASYTVPTATLTTTSQNATASNVTTLVAHKDSVTANDGTKNGIGGSLSTIDSLIDTPTNYTAGSGNNGGNYCTWNPLSETGATLANGNLEATLTAAGSGQENVRGTIAVSSGKFYWEELLSDTGNQSGHYGVVAASTGPNIRLDATSGANAVLYAAWNGNKAVDGTSTSYGASFTTNDIIGVALDLDAGTITFYKNNVSQGSINLPTTGIAYTPTFAWSGGSSAGTTKTNWGQRSFSFTPPTGYKSLCTTNLADPTIADGSTAFDTKLYTGNGGTQTISGLNFSPDFTWIKNRNSSDPHILTDIVRGAGKFLQSQNTTAETDNSDTATAFSAFTSDGFTVGYNANWSTNTNSSPFVSWNWDAGANSSKTYNVTVVSDSGNKYRFDGHGTSAVTLDLEEGSTYVFDQSDSSNSGHPLRFSTTSDGTHGSGSEYTTGVTSTGTPGSAGAKTTIVVAASAPTLYYYCTNHSGMGGQINTNSTAGASNFDGSIQSTVRANPSAGFSIVSYSSSSNAVTVGHGLNAAPELIILKDRNNAHDWIVITTLLANTTDYLVLNSSAASANFGVDAPTSTTFIPSQSSNSNYIAYCWAPVAGYSAFGSYIGNGNATIKPYVNVGFRPAFILIKAVDITGKSWLIYDKARDGFNRNNDDLAPDLSNQENDVVGSANSIDIFSNGFQPISDNSRLNQSGAKYLFACFASHPFKTARAR